MPAKAWSPTSGFPRALASIRTSRPGGSSRPSASVKLMRQIDMSGQSPIGPGSQRAIRAYPLEARAAQFNLEGRLKLPICFLAVLGWAAGSSASAQDLTIVSRVTHDGGAPETATSYLSSERIRMAQGEGREAIIDYKLGQMISIDHRKKTYSITTQKDIDEFAARMQEQMNSPEMRQAREAMKDLPPEQRKAIEGFGAGLFEVEKVGTSRKIAGYACENWTVTMGKLSRSEECLTTELKFPVQTFDMYKRYMESMRGLMASM